MAFGGIQSDKNRRVYISQVAEATFGVAATLTHLFNCEAGTDVQGIVHDTRSDRDLANAKEYTTLQYPGRKRSPFTLVLPFSPEAWGFCQGYGLGDDTLAGSANDRTHAMVQPSMHSLVPSFTMQYNADGATYNSSTDWYMQGLYVKSWSLKIPRTGWPMLTIVGDGAGYFSAGSTITESSLIAPSLLVPAPKFKIRAKSAGTEGTTEWGGTWTYASSAGVFANTISSDFDLTPYLDEITISGDNNLQGEDAAGTSAAAGVVGTRPFYGIRSIKVEGTYLAGTDTIGFDRAISNSTQADNYELTMLMEWVSDTSTGTSSIRSGGTVLPLLAFLEKPKNSSSLEAARRTFSLEAKNVRAGTDYGAIKSFLVNPGAALWGA